MARRKLSSMLNNLKFMQRAALREEKTKKQDEGKGNFPTTFTITRKWCVLSCTSLNRAVMHHSATMHLPWNETGNWSVVTMEGDPHPGALKGRLSFQSFNPSVDKLYKEESRLGQPAAETTVSINQNGFVSLRESSASVEVPECAGMDKKRHEVNGNVKRKLEEVISEAQYPIKSPKNDPGNRKSWPNNSVAAFKKPAGDKLDWKILRPSNCQTK